MRIRILSNKATAAVRTDPQMDAGCARSSPTRHAMSPPNVNLGLATASGWTSEGPLRARPFPGRLQGQVAAERGAHSLSLHQPPTGASGKPLRAWISPSPDSAIHLGGASLEMHRAPPGVCTARRRSDLLIRE